MEYLAGHNAQANRGNPPWFRARITAIGKLLDEVPASDEQNSQRVLLRNGHIPKNLEKRFMELREFEYKLSFALDSPLTFRELTSFNTWFAINPEKICGKEVVTSSIQFPITIKGTKEDIINSIRGTENEDQDTESTSQTSNYGDESKNYNRFGDARRVLSWLVSDFNTYYHKELDRFNQGNKELDTRILYMEQDIFNAKGNQKKSKELHQQLKDLKEQHTTLSRAFENDWLDFCTDLLGIIKERAINMGIVITERENDFIPQEVLLTIAEGAGKENYWSSTISEVIQRELEYFKKSLAPQHQNNSELELEALAIEVELQLLKT